MYKLAIIGLLIAAFAAPASAAGQQARARHGQVKVLCPQTAIIRPGRTYAICGGRFWVRDPETGKLQQVSFWRLQHLNDPADGPDRP